MPFATDGKVTTADMSNDAAWLAITDAQYQDAVDGMMAGKAVTVDGGFAVIDPPPPAPAPTPPPPTLAEAKVAAHATVDRGFMADSSVLIGSYPEVERETWPNQQAEADAWHADNTVATPYLDAIATARGVDLAAFRQSVYDHVIQFKTTSASLVGKRQRLSDAIDAATTVDEVQAIVW